MAKIVGAYFTSHVPAIGGAIHRGDQQAPYWKPFFDGFPRVHEWLAEVKPDVAVVFNNGQWEERAPLAAPQQEDGTP